MSEAAQKNKINGQTDHNLGMLTRGRFTTHLSSVMEQINASISFDQRMATEDITQSIVHCRMLEKCQIISADDAAAIVEGLNMVKDEIVSGAFRPSSALEDIHMNIEARLGELIGEAAGKLQTARSRNDQVATDFKMWVRAAHDRALDLLTSLMAVLVNRANEYVASVMPGYTHLQIAQPTTFGHHLLAYVEMFDRDRGRFTDSRKRMNECPLGACALAGTSFPIDRHFTAERLGFSQPMRNSLDAVSDRDFALEYLSAASICMIHLSRLAEEIVCWLSPHFSFIKLSDEWTTGSSMMPQKRNPDAAEIIRGKTGRLLGSWVGIATVMKGLALTFSKDMQEDKERTFDAADTLEISLKAMHGMIQDLKADTTAMQSAAALGYSTATDLAEWLTRTLNIPFRQAHELTGKMVRAAEEQGCSLQELPFETVTAVDARIPREYYRAVELSSSVDLKQSFGGTAPELVREQVKEWIGKLAVQRAGSKN